MKPLHPQVRIVTDGGRTGYYVELYDGNVWERTSYSNFLRDRAEQHANWLSDVLEHARVGALNEAIHLVMSMVVDTCRERELLNDIHEELSALKEK